MLVDWIVFALVAVLAVLVLFYVFVFARDPDRAVPSDDGRALISPADGRVSHVLRTTDAVVAVDKGRFGRISSACSDVARECTIVSIVMTPLDVHFQRAPCAGVVKGTRYVPGRFTNAVRALSVPLLENEHNEVLIERRDGVRVKVIQIAGALARRIRCFVGVGKPVALGEHIGFIDLGSQVTMVFPSSFDVLVRPGERVVGGVSVIARG